ncbi:hypothetical protein AWE51_04895 [Aquimarina aggregata]|uniref:Uncharacterized protein n=2 Tax=Aquimarina aggregata TaxID=1642818 RepID=A0A162FAD2_9FLAO|nr:hypothetical protein AWE51_04895 [Aquimarina aggregata]
MDIKTIRENYKKMSIEELTKLVAEIKTLRPEAILFLQQELISREETQKALNITNYLLSIKYHISESVLFDYITKLKKKGFSETEIDKDLEEKHGIDKNYSQLIKSNLNSKGKENIIIGLAMIIIPLVFGIILISLNAFIGIFPLLLIGIGIWRLNKGLLQRKVNNKIKTTSHTI